MISKNRLKLIHSLEKKKDRLEEGLFVAEGPKLVGELMATMRPAYVAATAEWLEANAAARQVAHDVVTAEELMRASLLRAPQQVVALFPLPDGEAHIAEVAASELCLALDGVQDPGNLGTIVRLADWFGIRHVFCSTTTADVFAPKATQATMGALARVAVHYVDLVAELAPCPSPVYGTHLDGLDLYAQPLTPTGVIVMGNEGNGISAEVAQRVTRRLYIPPYPRDVTTVESLNVAIATAIICAEFRRRDEG